jgi:hypothetical protein
MNVATCGDDDATVKLWDYYYEETAGEFEKMLNCVGVQ